MPLFFSFLPFAAFLMLAGVSRAGAGTTSPLPGKIPVSTESVESSIWDVTVRPYGWLAGLEGTTGILGYTAETSISFDEILSSLDMTAALQLEAKRGRWLLLLDGMYLKMSAGAETPGRLLSTVNVEIEQIMAEAAVGYRIWENGQGYLDVFAGVRYMRLGGDFGFQVDAAGVKSLSEDLSGEAISRVSSAVRESASGAAQGAKSRAQASITRKVEAQLQQSLRKVLENHPTLPHALELFKSSNGPVSDAIRELVAARVAEKQESVETSREAISQRASRTGTEVRRAVAQAERKLAQRIETALRYTIPDQVSGTADWVDPIVGLRARFNFTDRFYAVGRADIGGFGVGSDLAWQAYAGLGWQASPRVTVELGYRCLQMDYTSGGFTYDTMTSGVFTALGIQF